MSALFSMPDLLTVILLLICVCTYVRGYRKGIFDVEDGSHSGLRGEMLLCNTMVPFHAHDQRYVAPRPILAGSTRCAALLDHLSVGLAGTMHASGTLCFRVLSTIAIRCKRLLLVGADAAVGRKRASLCSVKRLSNTSFFQSWSYDHDAHDTLCVSFVPDKCLATALRSA